MNHALAEPGTGSFGVGSLAGGWLLGLLLGLRHALEPDHVAALATMLEGGRRPQRAALLGVFWGMGHSATLLIVGGSLFAARAELPARLTDGFELLVAAMLLMLGARGVRSALRAGSLGPEREHRHGLIEHRHAGPKGLRRAVRSERGAMKLSVVTSSISTLVGLAWGAPLLPRVFGLGG